MIGYCGDPASRLADRRDDRDELLARIRLIVSDALSGEVSYFGGCYEIDKLLPHSVEDYRSGKALD